MDEQTQKLIAALMTAPGLVQSMRRDPGGFALRVAAGTEGAHVIAALKDLTGKLRFAARGVPKQATSAVSLAAPAPEAAALPTPLSAAAAVPSSRPSGDALPVACIVSLGAMMGSVAVLGTICAVAIVREEDTPGQS